MTPGPSKCRWCTANGKAVAVVAERFFVAVDSRKPLGLCHDCVKMHLENIRVDNTPGLPEWTEISREEALIWKVLRT